MPGRATPMQVFSSAQGGTEGAMVLSSEPVAWIPRDARLEGVAEAYGCFVTGDSMEPAYERGNLLLVNPTAAVGPGDDCLFLRETPLTQPSEEICAFARETTGKVSREQLTRLVDRHFDLTPYGLREMLDLARPIYQKTAAYGHFGRELPEFTWERTDRVAELQRAVGL